MARRIEPPKETSGDLKKFFEDHYARLLCILLKRSRNDPRMADAVQSAYLKLFESGAKYLEAKSPFAYLIKTCIREWRREQRRDWKALKAVSGRHVGSSGHKGSSTASGSEHRAGLTPGEADGVYSAGVEAGVFAGEAVEAIVDVEDLAEVDADDSCRISLEPRLDISHINRDEIADGLAMQDEVERFYLMLSKQEKEVCDLWIAGKDTDEIAQSTGLSPDQVERRRTNVNKRITDHLEGWLGRRSRN